MNRCRRPIDQLVRWVSEVAQNAPGLVVPVSGGSDGALTLWVCAQALPDKTSALHFGSNLRARGWFESVAPVEFQRIPEGPSDPEALRWALTASFCRQRQRWPVGSRNRSEDQLHTYSRPSLIATILPIVGVWKSTVMELAVEIGVPAEILHSSRQADPACGRPQEMVDIGIEALDLFLKVRVGEEPESALTRLSAPTRAYLDELYLYGQTRAGLPHRGPQI